MNPKPTRRAVGKLLIAAPAALSVADLACRTAGEPKSAEPTTPPLSAKERQDLAKAVAQLRRVLDSLNKMPIPMGSEPGFLFNPVPPKK